MQPQSRRRRSDLLRSSTRKAGLKQRWNQTTVKAPGSRGQREKQGWLRSHRSQMSWSNLEQLASRTLAWSNLPSYRALIRASPALIAIPKSADRCRVADVWAQ
ncbi:hypothetical protein TIFTF001_031016 [Ficus carica]|uniref:Uncharacterized protein n=1 Tax=Ficus carica TaxID=3494 RepID=A0AA88DUI8_FICCA|nr:hypothetical protein TIFTF001_031016 [Ficus carica]